MDFIVNGVKSSIDSAARGGKTNVLKESNLNKMSTGVSKSSGDILGTKKDFENTGSNSIKDTIRILQNRFNIIE